MEFKGRSIYNLLRSSAQEESEFKENPWCLWDYRSFSELQLFSMIADLKISLSKEHFMLYAESCDTPEELLECLWVNESDVDGQERAYLIFFELWRRLFSHKRSLSIFFDELDFLIASFDEGLSLEEENMRKVLSELEDILHQGEATDEFLSSIFSYAAHDVESFLYDYISELLDEGNESLASLFITAFKKNVIKKRWFAFLQIRLLALSDLEELQSSIHRIVEDAEEEGDLLFA